MMHNRSSTKPTAIDLFSGCGGLTLGLKRAGFDVVGAVESEELAQETFALNHRSTKLFKSDIQNVNPDDLLRELEGRELDLLAGCPPCQGFSTIGTRNRSPSTEDERNELVFEFGRFAKALNPNLIMMENVPALAKDNRIDLLIKQLTSIGYFCNIGVFDGQNFGAPQRRKRMILIGSKSHKPRFAEPVSRKRTVRGAIGNLEGTAESSDPLHNYSVKRSKKILRLFKAIPKDGGSRHELPKRLMLECHKDLDGFHDVYGRMSWDAPAPTITGGCINPSKGRFLHPQEDRAITLREAALLQGFPKNYKFSLQRGRYPLAQMIGNAFPPIFAQKHALELKKQFL